MPSPSPSKVPSAAASNGRHSPDSDNAGVLVKHMYMKISLRVSTPPVSTTSARPSKSSSTPIEMAANELAQAASVTAFEPPRSRRLATRPATTLPSRPGKLASLQGVKHLAISSAAFFAAFSSMPAARIPAIHWGHARREAIWPNSSCPEVTPRMQEIRERSTTSRGPPKQSSRAVRATSSANNCAVSVDGSSDGGMPSFKVSNGTLGKKAPRRA